MAWGKCVCITFIVLSSQFFIYFVSKCRILLIRLICLVFLIKMVLSIHGFCSGRTIFPHPHRVQDLVPTPTWCGHRSNYQIVSTFVFLLSAILIGLLLGDFVFFFLRMCFYLSILGSLCMIEKVHLDDLDLYVVTFAVFATSV